MINPNARTDLACEAHARLKRKLKGAQTVTLTLHGCTVEQVEITDDEAAQAIGKPIGKYYTLNMEEYVKRRSQSFSAFAFAISDILKSIDFVSSSRTVLVACLGNKAITPDAIGPLCADSVIVTRHLKSSLPEAFADFSSVAVFKSGVLGTTGVESAESIRAMCDLVKPDCVIAIDALAAASPDRLCKTIQICDTGISPGSGVGNNRAQLNAEMLGVPTCAIGVPTVVDAASFSDDVSVKGLFVTPRNIDELVKGSAKLIAYGLNLALHNGMTIEDINTLVE